MEHTKWKVMLYTRRDSDNVRWVKSDDGKQTICQTFKPNAEAKARRIVECCNGWDELVKENERLRQGIICDSDNPTVLVPKELFEKLETIAEEAKNEQS